MLTLLSEIHFWSTQEDVIVKHPDFGSFKYYSKKDPSDSLCYQSKKKYCDQRGVIWHLPNKRPQKLRDRLKELEEYLLHNKIVCFSWSDNHLQLLLSTGVVVTLTIDITTGDLTSLTFDKSLATKLQVNILCDGVILGPQIICICNDGHVLGFGGSWKDGWIVEGGPRRHLNFHNDWLAVWGKCEAEHPQPWSPLGKDYQRANLHLYWVGVRGPELLAYKKTDGDPIEVIVSRTIRRTLFVIEQKVTLRGAVSVELSNFELVGANLKRVSVISVPLQTQVSCCALNEQETRLLIGCIDGSLALLDRVRGSTRTVKGLFIPKFARWNSLGAVVTVLNERGQLQYFDTALNGVKSQIMGEDCTPTALIDLSGYFNSQFTISSVSWGPKDLVVVLEQGPMLLITHIDRSLSFKSLSQRYIKMGKIDKAIRLLLSWEFNEESFHVLQKIVAYLLSQPMTDDTAKYLQDALGCFHSPPVPLNPETRSRFFTQIFSLTRRFFHQLVRAQMFETAFLLAVDLGHHDLFMDLHYIAVQIGETEMAAAARAQASALLSRCSSEASNCTRSSCSQCSGSSDENPDNYLTTNFNNPQPKTYPRATFVKAPQVPANFKAPPLPNLGIPRNVFKPPLPSTGAVKKVPPKVKFSDTVTAFIVPEIKRPARPPPPPHFTDPQKELADSLPLCHPNEDYLKDFNPVRRRESEEAQPKIKVVHFGVV
ncbi:WD repeat-containing and planar cell polarity effector protein fritz [Tribolium castaneum]|uniref:WD repeat-containing and planar cell polarity effector protein fritz n=1 Tax=Tribolium castaneum TaxID=7070 RepID=UPI0030FECC0B